MSIPQRLVPVALVVEDRRAEGPAVVADVGLVGDVAERPVAVVAPEGVAEDLRLMPRPSPGDKQGVFLLPKTAAVLPSPLNRRTPYEDLFLSSTINNLGQVNFGSCLLTQ